VRRTRDFCRAAGVTVLQAPREADPQLAFLALNGLADVVVTEDTDLIVYGCPVIAFKFNPSGWCRVYEKQRFEHGLTDDSFRWACILAGCDYMQGGVRGLGLAKATKLLRRFCSRECLAAGLFTRPPYDEEAMRCILRNVCPDSDDDLVQRFMVAELSFLHQRVVDTRDGQVKRMTPFGGKRVVRFNDFRITHLLPVDEEAEERSEAEGPEIDSAVSAQGPPDAMDVESSPASAEVVESMDTP
jgi:exonuclease 1